MFKVRLDDHVGKQKTAVGPVDIVFDQYKVMVQRPDDSWVHIGYVWTQGGSVKLIVDLPRHVSDEIDQQVATLLVEKNGGKPLTQPVTKAIAPKFIPDEDDVVDAEDDDEEILMEEF